MLAQQPSGNVRQRQAAETRVQLLTAACEVFKERGYQAASVGAITDRAKTAHGTFYLYFRNKEDAFCQVMETVVIGELVASAQAPEEAPPREALEQVIRGFLRAYVPHAGLWRAVLEGAFQSERIHTLWLQLRRVFIEGIIAGVREGQAVGTIRPIDPVLSAHALAAMTEWFSFACFELREPAIENDDIEKPLAVLVDLWYHAVYGEVPPSV